MLGIKKHMTKWKGKQIRKAGKQKDYKKGMEGHKWNQSFYKWGRQKGLRGEEGNRRKT